MRRLADGTPLVSLAHEYLTLLKKFNHVTAIIPFGEDEVSIDQLLEVTADQSIVMLPQPIKWKTSKGAK